MKKLLALTAVMLFAASLSFGQTTEVPTTTLSVTVGAESAIVVGTTPAFISSGIFGAYTTSTP